MLVPTLLLIAVCASHGFLSTHRHIRRPSLSSLRRYNDIPSLSMSLNNEIISFSHNDVFDLFSSVVLAQENDVEAGAIGYSNLSLYFTLALYILTLPGLYSLVTRSVKITPTRRTYDLPGPANPTARSTREIAAEIMAYFKALNYEVTAAEDIITFRGVMGRSNSQAAFLTFCTFIGLGSVGLVLSILLPDLLGAKAYLITLLSPYAGIYYWNNAQRGEEVTIKMETSDDEQMTSIFAQGGKEELERFSRALELQERGKVYVKGLFDESGDSAAIKEAAADMMKQLDSPNVNAAEKADT